MVSSTEMPIRRRTSRVLCWVALVTGSACASVPTGQYAVDSLDFEGVERMDSDALSRCLLTVERPSFGIPLGIDSTDCEAPPFDSSAPTLELWRWPWTDWPAFNVAVMRVDKARIERWYRARGFYDAKVTAVRVTPPAAVSNGQAREEGECDPDVELCTVQIRIYVDEGEPLRVSGVTVEGVDALDAELVADLRTRGLPEVDARFDEHDYDRAKAQLAERLAEAGYPGAKVHGEVRLDHIRKRAAIAFSVEPGPRYRFGWVRVSGQDELPVDPIVAAADVQKGDVYRQSVLSEVQREVYALGAFSAVTVERKLDEATRRANILVKVSPLPKHAFRVGVGITSGAQRRSSTGFMESIPQWDIHLSVRYERRHVLGTLGRLLIEEKPRLIYPQQFPGTTKLPRLGNLLRVCLNQPGLIERRTDLVANAQWDLGPEPFLGFMRSDIALRLSAERAFFRPLFFGSLAVEHDRLFVQDDSVPAGFEVPVSYRYTFLEQMLRFDLRDDDVEPRKGIYAQVQASEAAQLPAMSDWTLIGLQSDLRAYVPLPFGMVLAGRFALAANFVLDSANVDGTSAELGPTSYRLRGGGAQSNRGYLAGELGAGLVGGIRRWESSAELRIRLGGSFGLVGFYDMGNVSRTTSFGFGEAHPSLGFGLRYLTIVGAIRFDVGFRLRGADELSSRLFIFGGPGAMHLTIGEAF